MIRAAKDMDKKYKHLKSTVSTKFPHQEINKI